MITKQGQQENNSVSLTNNHQGKMRESALGTSEKPLPAWQTNTIRSSFWLGKIGTPFSSCSKKMDLQKKRKQWQKGYGKMSLL